MTVLLILCGHSQECLCLFCDSSLRLTVERTKFSLQLLLILCLFGDHYINRRCACFGSIFCCWNFAYSVFLYSLHSYIVLNIYLKAFYSNLWCLFYLWEVLAFPPFFYYSHERILCYKCVLPTKNSFYSFSLKRKGKNTIYIWIYSLGYSPFWAVGEPSGLFNHKPLLLFKLNNFWW